MLLQEHLQMGAIHTGSPGEFGYVPSRAGQGLLKILLFRLVAGDFLDFSQGLCRALEILVRLYARSGGRRDRLDIRQSAHRIRQVNDTGGVVGQTG
jgi:hypothetical protein